MLRPTTPGVPRSNYPKSAKALNGNVCACVCGLPGDDASAWVARTRAPGSTSSLLEAFLALLLLCLLEMSLKCLFFCFYGFVDTTDFFSTFFPNLTWPSCLSLHYKLIHVLKSAFGALYLCKLVDTTEILALVHIFFQLWLDILDVLALYFTCG